MSRVVKLGVLAAGVVLACSGNPDTVPDPNEHAGRQKTPEPAANTPPPVARLSPPSFVSAPVVGDVAVVVAKHVQAADAAHRWLVVYVGAEWCAPCREFRDAVQAGSFNTQLAGITFLEFDADRDRDRLTRAGYNSRMIPLLAVPNPDGSSSKLRSEGGIKGPKAAGYVAQKLLRMLQSHPTKPYPHG